MPMKRLTVLALILSIFTLASGCSSESEVTTSSNGGSSSNGGTTSTSAPAPAAETPDQFAGTYVGSGTATASALGISESETAPVTIVIDKDGTVTVKSGSDIFGNVTVLNGNTFSYSQSLNDEDLGSVSCSGTLSINGTISNGVIDAGLSSDSVNCGGLPVTVTGSLKATRQ